MPETATNPITAVAARKVAAEKALRELEHRHVEEHAAADREVAEARTALQHALAGTLPEVRERAARIIKVGGSEYDHGVVLAAMDDLATGARHLRDRTISVKNYDRYRHQREDSPYGYGPRHGRIVFSVGLTKEARAQSHLDPGDIEAALIYLGNYRQAKEG